MLIWTVCGEEIFGFTPEKAQKPANSESCLPNGIPSVCNAVGFFSKSAAEARAVTGFSADGTRLSPEKEISEKQKKTFCPRLTFSK